MTSERKRRRPTSRVVLAIPKMMAGLTVLVSVVASIYYSGKIPSFSDPDQHSITLFQGLAIGLGIFIPLIYLYYTSDSYINFHISRLASYKKYLTDELYNECLRILLQYDMSRFDDVELEDKKNLKPKSDEPAEESHTDGDQMPSSPA